jgi:membrane-bound serine protease (ClpP class)
VFITLASHVAAMAPGTNIGAAHPVQVGGLPGGPKEPEKKENGEGARPGTPLEEKVLNDTVAWARSLAELRGRDVEWATRAVKESLSVSAKEAVDEGVVEIFAEDVEDLLGQLHGREVRLATGPVQLHTRDADVRTVEMWWGERVLGALANPNVAFLLLLFGFYGVLFELYTPGWGVAGTLGVICLILGFFALAVLPVNYVGLALLVLALILFVSEVFVTSYGFLTLGGAVCLVLSGLMLVESPVGFQRISLWVLVPVALATAAITFFLVGSIVKAQRGKPLMGIESLAGVEGTATETFVASEGQYAGMVRARGEWWKAVSSTPVTAGERVTIQDRRGLTLVVQPLQNRHETSGNLELTRPTHSP